MLQERVFRLRFFAVRVRVPVLRLQGVPLPLREELAKGGSRRRRVLRAPSPRQLCLRRRAPLPDQRR